MGGTGRAASEVEEGIFLNPAVLPHSRDFSSSLFYADGENGEGLGETVLGLTLVDNTEGVIVPGGLSYLRKRRTFPDFSPVDEHYCLVSVGGFLDDHLTGGLSLHYRSLQQESGLKESIWNGSLGFIWAPQSNWGLALVWDHFISSQEKGLPISLRDLPELGFGLVYIYERIFRFRADLSKALLENPQEKWRLGLGLETFTDTFFAVRLGAEVDDRTNAQFMTTGLAFAGPRLKMDYSFRKNLKSGGGAMHGVDFRIPF